MGAVRVDDDALGERASVVGADDPRLPAGEAAVENRLVPHPARALGVGRPELNFADHANAFRIVAEAYGKMPVATVPSLAPVSEPEAFAEWLGRQRIAEVVGAVGHDPHLGMLVTWLLAGRMEPRVDIEKGGAVLLEVEGAPRASCATLLWALAPAMLVRLGD